jgi:Ca2+:H+ antiporter
LIAKGWWTLLPLGPLAFLGDRLGWSPTLVFIVAGLGTVPAAALLGRATEEIAAGITVWDVRRHASSGHSATTATLGAKVGGLLNATFGNIPELIVGVLALQHGYITLTKATIAGSIIGNAALVLGLALLLGGARHGVQRFDPQEAGHHAVLMALAVASLALPSVFLSSTHSSHITEISVVAATLLLATYLAYLLYSIFRVQGGNSDDDATFIDEEAKIVRDLGPAYTSWSLRTSIVVLGLATLLVFGAAEALIHTVQPFTAKFGWSPVFVGVIVVPALANVAEHASAVMLALKNKTDMALAVASGSSTQVAVFVAPLLVFVSQFWHRLDLAFSPIEIAALAMVVAIFYLVARDGESNWLEGLQLIVLYVLAATVFFYVPGSLS